MDGDIRLVWDVLHASIALNDDGTDFATDAGLETAVIISLFTDRRASETDELPATETDRRGWWGNTLQSPDDDEEIGSKLWLLRREKEMPVVLIRAREYATDALKWLVRDKVASRVDVNVSIARPGWLFLNPVIHRPSSRIVEYRFDYNWQSQESRIVS